jgi:serpin B
MESKKYSNKIKNALLFSSTDDAKEYKNDRQNSNFQTTLLRTLEKSNSFSNILISPLSIYIALTLTANGAKGETQKSIIQTLKNSNADIEQLNKKCISSLKLSKKENKGTDKFYIANAIFTKVKPKDDFKFKAVKEFQSMIELLKDIDPVNEWCEKKTNGKIQQILSQLPEDCAMIILNAVYFFGEWKRVFNPANTILNAKFYLQDESIKEVPMMFQTMEDVQYFEDEEVQVIDLPYSDNLSAFIILPRKSMSAFLQNLNDENIKTFIKKLYSCNVHLYLPKFKIESTFKLKEHLKEMGMEICFGDSADFRNITEEEDLTIDYVIHKTFMEVDEKGTEAAVVTAGITKRKRKAVRREEPKYYTMEINKPFIFCVRHKKIEQLMFIALVNKV